MQMTDKEICKEYREHHEQMQSLMALVGDKILKWKEAIE